MSTRRGHLISFFFHNISCNQCLSLMLNKQHLTIQYSQYLPPKGRILQYMTGFRKGMIWFQGSETWSIFCMAPTTEQLGNALGKGVPLCSVWTPNNWNQSFLPECFIISSAWVWHFSTIWEPTKTDVIWQLSRCCKTSFLARKWGRGGKSCGKEKGGSGSCHITAAPCRHALQISLTSSWCREAPATGHMTGGSAHPGVTKRLCLPGEVPSCLGISRLRFSASLPLCLNLLASGPDISTTCPPLTGRRLGCQFRGAGNRVLQQPLATGCCSIKMLLWRWWSQHAPSLREGRTSGVLLRSLLSLKPIKIIFILQLEEDSLCQACFPHWHQVH